MSEQQDVTVQTTKRFTLVEPVQIGEATYTEFEVVPLTFARFVESFNECIEDLQAEEIEISTVYMGGSVNLISGEIRVPYDVSSRDMLPITVGMQIRSLVTPKEQKRGSVVSAGDCITKSCSFKLGTPLIPTQGDPITELEFIAHNYSDIEPVLAVESNKLKCTLALLKKCASCTSLLQIPQALIDKISYDDGMAITEKVLPGFLEELNKLAQKFQQ